MSFKVTLKYSWNKLRFYLSFLLLAFYLSIAFAFFFTNAWVDLLPKGRVVIGIVLFLFGILRFYVAYRRYINKKRKITYTIEIKKDEEVK